MLSERSVVIGVAGSFPVPENRLNADASPPGSGGVRQAGSQQAAEAITQPYRWRWLVLAVMICAAIINQLDGTVISVAGPSIQSDLGGGEATIQWLSAGYILPFAVLLIMGGRLGDIYGRRRLFLLGILGFTVASLACALAPTPLILIGARVAQGISAALLVPQSFGIVRSVFPRRELGAAFATFAPAIGLATVGGPLLAGTLIGADFLGSGWRMIFAINLPLGILALVGAMLFVPRDQDRIIIRLDLLGVALVAIATTLTIYPLVQGREQGWPAWMFGLLVGGLFFFGVFVRYEHRTKRTPVIESSLLSNRTFLIGIGVVMIFFCVLVGFLFVSSLYFQVGLHYSALRTALVGLPLTCGIVIASIATRSLTDRFGRRLLLAGLLTVVGGFALLSAASYLAGTLDAWTFTPGALVLGLGLGTVFGPLFGVILGAVSDSEVGSASGTLSAVQQLGGALGIATITTLYFELAGHDRHVSALTETSLVSAAAAATAFALAFALPRRARSQG
ncbi:MFS transporter [Actinomadura sp. 3N508]|uniref:MFS transporter n=1 Tax=Actinomadura sp. 3N508 TaxID=3375153 RepID=UPI0037976778